MRSYLLGLLIFSTTPTEVSISSHLWTSQKGRGKVGKAFARNTGRRTWLLVHSCAHHIDTYWLPKCVRCAGSWGDSSEWGRHGPNPYGAENLAALYVCNTGPWKGSCWQRPRVSSHLNGRLSTSETCPPVSFLITSSLPLSLPAKWLPILSSFLPLLA